jgi:hypothetical protein
MKRILLCVLALVAQLTVCAMATQAAVPTFIPIQGELSDAQGLAIDEEVSVNFSLYPSEGGFNPVWSETQSVDVLAGRFMTYLGAVTPLSTQLVSEHHDLWIGIKVGADSAMERVPLGTVPFAAFAQYCGTVPSHTHAANELTGVVAAGQKCQIGQVVVGFDAQGQAICEPIPAGGGGASYSGEDFAVSGMSCPPGQVMTGISTFGMPVCMALPGNNGGGGNSLAGSGTAKKLAQFTDATTLGASVITQYNNKIGVNESFPSRTVEIKGDLEVTGDFYWGGNAFSSSSCLVVGGTSCSSACSKHSMSCYKAFRMDGDSDSTSCGQSGFKFCCCKN